MSYTEKTISIFGTEIEFLQAFIAAITAADSRITCTTNDLETQFANDSNTPSFTLSVDGIYMVTFTRSSSLDSSSSNYPITSSAYSGNSPFSFSNNPYAKDTRVTRTWRFSVVTNSNDIYLKLAAYDANLNSPNKKWLSIKNNAISACAVGTGSTNIMSSGFVSSGGQVYQKVDRLPYTYNASDLTKVEVINSKTFVENGTTNRAFETDKIIDSTTVTADQIISINSTKYYALDSNTLMEI